MDNQVIQVDLKNLDRYRSPRKRAWVVTFVLGLFGLVLVGSVVSSLMESQLIRAVQAGETITMAEALRNDFRQTLVGALYLVMGVVAAIVFLFWIHRVSWNIRHLRLSSEALARYTPGWAIGWWFIPFMSLWKPYQVMREIWTRSHPERVRSRLMLVWWIAWVVSSILANRFFFDSLFGTSQMSLSQLAQHNLTGLIVDVGSLLAGLLVLVLVWQISNAQDRKHRELVNHSATISGEEV